MSVESTIIQIAKNAKAASIEIAKVSAAKKNQALYNIAEAIEREALFIKKENNKDLLMAKKKNLTGAMIDRLTISDATIKSMTDGLREIAALDDPVGAISDTLLRPNGLEVSRMRIPLGVIGIIYESRPTVTVDAAGLCLKAGNAVILRGGSESLNSNKALADLIGKALLKTGLPETIIQIIPVRDRAAVNFLFKQRAYRAVCPFIFSY